MDLIFIFIFFGEMDNRNGREICYCIKSVYVELYKFMHQDYYGDFCIILVILAILFPRMFSLMSTAYPVQKLSIVNEDKLESYPYI